MRLDVWNGGLAILLFITAIIILMVFFIGYDFLINLPKANQLCQDNGFDAANRWDSFCYKVLNDGEIEGREYFCPNLFSECYLMKEEAEAGK